MNQPTDPWDPASEPIAGPPGDGNDHGPGPSFQAPYPGASAEQSGWAPVSTGAGPAMPPRRPGDGPDWQQTADLSRPTAVEPYPAVPVVPPPGRRRGRRVSAPVIVGIVVAALVVVLIGADRVAAVVAGQRVGSQVAADRGLSEAPSVHFAGFPFLTQLAASDFGRIDVAAQDVPIRQQTASFTVRELTATLEQVRVGDDDVRIARLRGNALLDYRAVSSLVGQQVGYAGRDASGGRVKIALTAGLSVTAGLRFDAASKKFQVRDVRLDAAGQSLPGGAAEPVINRLMKPVSQLPDGVDLSRIDVTAEGVRVHGTGDDLVLPR